MVFFSIIFYLCLLWVVTAVSRGSSLAVLHSLLAAGASLVAELGLGVGRGAWASVVAACKFSSCGAQA